MVEQFGEAFAPGIIVRKCLAKTENLRQLRKAQILAQGAIAAPRASRGDLGLESGLGRGPGQDRERQR
jgi:hypothetical protein